jgi:hypothetical protein
MAEHHRGVRFRQVKDAVQKSFAALVAKHLLFSIIGCNTDPAMVALLPLAQEGAVFREPQLFCQLRCAHKAGKVWHSCVTQKLHWGISSLGAQREGLHVYTNGAQMALELLGT